MTEPDRQAMDGQEEDAMRLFVAIPLPKALLETVLECQRLLGEKAPCSLTCEPNLHLTLAFLGKIPSGNIDAAKEALAASCAAAVRCVRLKPVRLGSFGKPDKALVWLGIERDEALIALASRLRVELGSRSLPFDKAGFLPHVTIARRARLSTGLPEIPVLAETIAEEAVLYESRLSADGASYRPLASFPLPDGQDA